MFRDLPPIDAVVGRGADYRPSGRASNPGSGTAAENTDDHVSIMVAPGPTTALCHYLTEEI